MLLAFVVFIGCRQELDVINPEKQSEVYQLTKDNVKTKMLKKADYDNMEYLQADVTKVSNFLKTKQNKEKSSSKSIQVINGYEVYTDAFEEVSYLDAKYHSFYIISDKDPNAYEEKLVLKSVNDKIIEIYIVRYKRKPDFSIDAGSYQTLKLSDPTAANSKIMYVDTFSMGCSTYVVTSYECGYTGHHTNGQYCNVLNINMPYNTVSITFDPSCTAGGSGSGESGSSSGGGGGAVPGSYTPPVITIPTSAPIYTTHGPKGKTCNPLALNSSEIDQINNDQSLRLRIYQYIAASGSGYPLPCEDSFFADEYKAFIKAIIKYVTDTNTPANDLTFDYLNSAYQFFQDEYYDMTQPENFLHRVKALDNALAQNPNKLLNIPCNQLPHWQDIAMHQIPQSVKSKLSNIPYQNSYWSSWNITNLDDGAGTHINMDLFPIKISKMPKKPNSTQKYTPAEFFDFFRKNLNLFAEKFTPIENNYYNIHDTALWNSANPLGALIHIDITPDDGTVVCSGVSTNTWIFSTIKAPQGWSYDGIHPVSGNRAFSYYMDGATMYIYTRGVDRTSKINDEKTTIVNYIMEAIAFSAADDLWTEMQNKLSKYVNDREGDSNVITPVKYRPNYDGIKNYLKGKTPLSSVGCN